MSEELKNKVTHRGMEIRFMKIIKSFNFSGLSEPEDRSSVVSDTRCPKANLERL